MINIINLIIKYGNEIEIVLIIIDIVIRNVN